MLSGLKPLKDLGGGIIIILLTEEVLGGGLGIGGGAGVAIPAGDFGRDLKEGPRLEILGGKELQKGLSIRGGVKYYPLQGERQDYKLNLLSSGISAHFRTSESKEKISLLLSAELGWNWMDRSFQTGRERENGPFLGGEGGISLPFGDFSEDLSLEGILNLERHLSQKPGDLYSLALRIWYQFNEN